MKGRINAQEGANNVTIAGQSCPAVGEIMISPLMLKVNGSHEEWAERHTAAPQVVKNLHNAHGTRTEAANSQFL